MSLPEIIPSNLPQFVQLKTRTAFADSVIPSGAVLLFAESDGQGGSKLIAKNSDGSFSEIGGGGGGSMNFYKCASASNGTWTGYLASIDSTTGIWSFAETASAGLVYNMLPPFVGKVYAYTDGYIFEVDTEVRLIPSEGLLCSALPDSNWVSGNSVSQWGDFVQSNTSKQPQLATIGGVVGIKTRSGDELITSAKPITGDFSYLAKFCIGDTSATKMNLLQCNSWYGAIFGFENVDGDVCFLLSKQGVGYIGVPVTLSSLGVGTHTAAVTYAQSTGETKFYFDGVLSDTKTYNPSGGFDYSSNFLYSQSMTSDNLVLGLAAYDRVLSAAEIAGISW